MATVPLFIGQQFVPLITHSVLDIYAWRDLLFSLAQQVS
jgi:hypothetical protein